MVASEPHTFERRRGERMSASPAVRTATPYEISFLALIGRILLAAIFIPSGFGKIAGWSQTLAGMTAKGLPYPDVLLVITIVLELAGAAMLIMGWYARFAAAALAAFVLIAGLVYHDFWAAEPAQYMNQFNHFMKNIGIVGGLLMVVALGPGSMSANRR